MFEAEEIFERKGLGGSSHASTLTEGPDGTIYSVWYSGSAEKEADVKIFMSKKTKGGNWVEPWLIEKEGITSENPFLDEAEDEKEREAIRNEETSEGNPVIFKDPDKDRLWLFWETMRGAGDKSGWTMCVLKVKHSDDWGKTWTKVRTFRKNIGWGTRNKPIKMSNGEILLPVSCFGTSFYLFPPEEFSKGSQECRMVEPTKFITGRWGQPSVIENANKELIVFMRTSESSPRCENLIAISKSRDYGLNWSKVSPTKDKIPNPDSGLDAVTLKNGHVVLVCNPLKSGRQKLTVFLSEDDGETFPFQRDLEIIEQDKNYHYPAVIQASDGLIHVTYTYRRLNIKHACFNEAWIKGE
ncbi:MAG: exo-alpha-sialidase [Candidatus Hodarchaeota archaeon]